MREMRDARKYWSMLMFYFIFMIGTAIVSGLLAAATSFILFKMVFTLMMFGILLGMFMVLGVLCYQDGVSFGEIHSFFKRHWDQAFGRDEEEYGKDG